jgi:hypothetical protein
MRTMMLIGLFRAVLLPVTNAIHPDLQKFDSPALGNRRILINFAPLQNQKKKVMGKLRFFNTAELTAEPCNPEECSTGAQQHRSRINAIGRVMLQNGRRPSFYVKHLT